MWNKGLLIIPVPSAVKISGALSISHLEVPLSCPIPLSWCFPVQEPPSQRSYLDLVFPTLDWLYLGENRMHSFRHRPVELKLWWDISRPEMSSWEERRGKTSRSETWVFSHILYHSTKCKIQTYFKLIRGLTSDWISPQTLTWFLQSPGPCVQQE